MLMSVSVCDCVVFGEGFIKGETFEQRLERSKESIWGKHIPGRGKSRCKSLEA